MSIREQIEDLLQDDEIIINATFYNYEDDKHLNYNYTDEELEEFLSSLDLKSRSEYNKGELYINTTKDKITYDLELDDYPYRDHDEDFIYNITQCNSDWLFKHCKRCTYLIQYISNTFIIGRLIKKDIGSNEILNFYNLLEAKEYDLCYELLK